MLIFGTPIFRGNYVIHDVAQNTIGFAPHVGSSKDAPIAGEVPKNTIGGVYKASSGSIWSWFIVVVIIIVMTVIFALAIYPAISNWNLWGLVFFGVAYFGITLGLMIALAQPAIQKAINKGNGQ